MKDGREGIGKGRKERGEQRGERMGEKMQKKMPVISQMPTAPSIVYSQHRVQEAAMVAVRVCRLHTHHWPQDAGS